MRSYLIRLNYRQTINAYVVLIVFFNLSCDSFIEIEDPKGQVPQSAVFEDESSATAALTTLYGKLRDDTLLQGTSMGLSTLLGLYSDELKYHGYPGSSMEAFYSHQIIPSNDIVKNTWNSSYNLIYMSNSIIEGIESSSNLSISVKQQLQGEALFIRALIHSYLVNLFDSIPYITTTDHMINKGVSRIESANVYDFIILDLIKAKSYLVNEYPSAERVRANSNVVSALLARIYLQQKDWEKAEMESSFLINNKSAYLLENDIDEEFLKNSSSTILQLKPKMGGDNTKEAGLFLFEFGPPLVVSLNESFIGTFEEGDLRKDHWIKVILGQDQIWYTPYKYKLSENTGTSYEYSILLRLSEQLLIRAESRVMLGDFNGAKEDINIIRNRANLQSILSGSAQDLLDAILIERKHELFTEHGHRWFDLKRLNKANECLAPIKSGWKDTNLALPIPESELLLNPKLAPQNSGY